MAIISYRNAGTRDIAENENSKAARRLLPTRLHVAARRLLFAIEAMIELRDLAAFPSWRLDKLKGERSGQYSVRINDQCRVCFTWDGTDAEAVEIVDYH
jgi:toxin HigB-1